MTDSRNYIRFIVRTVQLRVSSARRRDTDVAERRRSPTRVGMVTRSVGLTSRTVGGYCVMIVDE